jgi:hypothetical protein
VKTAPAQLESSEAFVVREKRNSIGGKLIEDLGYTPYFLSIT